VVFVSKRGKEKLCMPGNAVERPCQFFAFHRR
jgi:hypothetical protein